MGTAHTLCSPSVFQAAKALFRLHWRLDVAPRSLDKRPRDESSVTCPPPVFVAFAMQLESRLSSISEVDQQDRLHRVVACAGETISIVCLFCVFTHQKRIMPKASQLFLAVASISVLTYSRQQLALYCRGWGNFCSGPSL